MTPTLPLAIDVTTRGGEALLVVVLFVSVFLAIGLGALVTVRMIRGYRRTQNRQLLGLGIGLLLLVVAPKALTLVLATLTGAGTNSIGATAAAIRLTGLSTLLWAIYAE